MHLVSSSVRGALSCSIIPAIFDTPVSILLLCDANIRALKQCHGPSGGDEESQRRLAAVLQALASTLCPY